MRFLYCLIIAIDLPSICIRVHRFYERVIGEEAVHAEETSIVQYDGTATKFQRQVFE